jgi:hypothetical protein
MPKKLTIEEFIQKAVQKHGKKYDYSLVILINCQTKVKIICPVHGIFEQTPVMHLRGQECHKCSLFKQKEFHKHPELYFKEGINKSFVHGYKFTENDFKKNCHKDKIKNNFCKEHNIKLIRISYKKINKIEKILTKKLF